MIPRKHENKEKDIQISCSPLQRRRFLFREEEERQCLFLILKSAFIRDLYAYRWVQCFRFSKSLNKSLSYVNGKNQTRKWFGIRGFFPFTFFSFFSLSRSLVSRWNISINDKSNICFCLFALISRMKRRKIQNVYKFTKQIFLLILQIPREKN